MWKNPIGMPSTHHPCQDMSDWGRMFIIDSQIVKLHHFLCEFVQYGEQVRFVLPKSVRMSSVLLPEEIGHLRFGILVEKTDVAFQNLQ